MKKTQIFMNRPAYLVLSILGISKNVMYEFLYLTGEEILPSDQSRIIEQDKFTYSSLGKAFKKQIKTIEKQGAK